MSKIDANSRYVGMGVDPNGDPIALKIDSVTGYLCVSASIGTQSSSTDTQSVDANSKGVATGVNPSGANQMIATNSNGEVYMTTA